MTTDNKRKPSAAPWFMGDGSVGHYEVYSSAREGSFRVATCVKDVDARLIAAAPELLAELKDATAWLEDIGFEFPADDDGVVSLRLKDIGEIQETARQARAAIGRATGEEKTARDPAGDEARR